MQYKMVRLCIQNWYLCQAQDIDIRDTTSFIGPTGAGKSSLQDAIQLVLCGNNHSRINLNSAATGKSQRTVVDYCLGYIDPRIDGCKPLRTECETVVAVVFEAERPDGSKSHISVGVAMEAREEDRRETPLCRFIAFDHAYSVENFREHDAEGSYLWEWADIERWLKSKCKLNTYRDARNFVSDMLASMRGHAKQPDTRTFLRCFTNALAFTPINDPSKFVMDYILEDDPLEIERVRQTVAHWKNLSEEAQKVEDRLTKLRVIRRKFDDWARIVIHAKNQAWEKACGAVEISRVRLRSAGVEFARITEDLNREQSAYARQNETLAEVRRQLSREIARRADTGQQAKLDNLDLEERYQVRLLADVEKEAKSIKSCFQLASNLVSIKDRLPGSFMATMAAAQAAISIISAKPRGGWLANSAEDVARHLASVKGLSALPDRLEPQITDAQGQLADLRKRHDALAGNISRAQTGAASLSDHTHTLMRLLKNEGIAHEVLCDVVEVVEKDWQLAAEMLLGLNREALIVHPSDLNRAFDILFRNRNLEGLHRCRLVKTTRTRDVELSIHKDSVAHALRSSNPHAWAYIVTNIGSFRKAEDVAALERASRAITREGRATASMSYSVEKRPQRLILGRDAKDNDADLLRTELAQVRDQIRELEGIVRRLGDGAKAATAVGAFEANIEDLAYRHQEVQSALRQIAQRRAEIQAEIDPEAQALIDGLNADINSRVEELAEMDAKIKGMIERKGALKNDNETKRAEMREAVLAKRAVISESRDADLRALAELAKDIIDPTFLTILNPFWGLRVKHGANYQALSKAVSARLAELASETRKVDLGRIEEQAKAALTEFLRDHAMAPIATVEHHGHYHYSWVILEITRLEKNDLLLYLDQAKQAEVEMVRAIKEDLLTKLKAKFDKLDIQLRTLNMHMKRHKFIGRVYGIYKKANPEYDLIRRLAAAVSDNPDGAQDIIERKSGDPLMIQAMDELESFLNSGSGEASDKLADYRNYYSYEMLMGASDDGDDRVDYDEAYMRRRDMVSLKGKVMTGSGGEGQSPFYVAIAVSMALAYYPGSAPGRSQSGMGVVLFDEAFSKPDIATTQHLIDFYKDMGLQLIVAAPEDKLPTFNEVMDTMVKVYKDQAARTVYITCEYPKEHARQELAKINPERTGLEGFRTIEKMKAEAAANVA